MNQARGLFGKIACRLPLFHGHTTRRLLIATAHDNVVYLMPMTRSPTTPPLAITIHTRRHQPRRRRLTPTISPSDDARVRDMRKKRLMRYGEKRREEAEARWRYRRLMSLDTLLREYVTLRDTIHSHCLLKCCDS